MKRIFGSALLLLLPLVVSCGGRGSEAASGADSLSLAAPAAEKGPAADPLNQQQYEAEIDGHRYEVSLRRYADREGGVVRNEMGEDSYDNCVEMNIMRDGSAFKAKTFTKSDFHDFLSDTDRAVSVLQGMTFVNADDKGLHFAAQVGERDTDGGMAFIVTVGTDGVVDIVRDYNQDTTGSAAE